MACSRHIDCNIGVATEVVTNHGVAAISETVTISHDLFIINSPIGFGNDEDGVLLHLEAYPPSRR
jgi:hypothetical protein